MQGSFKDLTIVGQNGYGVGTVLKGGFIARMKDGGKSWSVGNPAQMESAAMQVFFWDANTGLTTLYGGTPSGIHGCSNFSSVKTTCDSLRSPTLVVVSCLTIPTPGTNQVSWWISTLPNGASTVPFVFRLMP